VLWPEHFDVGITVDEVNYGVSPGDSSSASRTRTSGRGSPAPGPSGTPRSVSARPVADFTTVDALVAYFTEAPRRDAGLPC
jgi:hypothetical protein